MKKSLLFVLLTPLSVYATELPYGIDVTPKEKFALPVALQKAKRPLNSDGRPSFATYLLNMTDEDTRNLRFQNNPYDTHLKKEASRIKLNFTYHEIEGIPKENIIGFAPIGTYENNGWSGIVEFFKDKALGTCGYYYTQIDYVNISKEVVKRDVNNKITTVKTGGDPQNNYLNILEWYTPTKPNVRNGVVAQDLKCATNYTNIDAMPKLITLAKKIDKNVIIK